MEQQGNQNQSPDTTTHPGDPQKRKLIQQQLVLLLHAHKCQDRESQKNGDWHCSVPHCRTMKNVWNHMKFCQVGRNCSFPHCSFSRQILSHWKHCTRTDCAVCSPLKPAENTQTNNPGAVGGIQYATSTPGMANQTVNRGIQMPGLGAMQAQPSATANVWLTQPQAQAGPGQAGVVGGQFTAIPIQVTKEWHQSITQDLRNQFVYKLMQEIFPNLDPQAMLNMRMGNFESYAKKLEFDMCMMSNTRDEYYHLIAENIYKIQKSHDEVRQRLREKQLHAQQQQCQQ